MNMEKTFKAGVIYEMRFVTDSDLRVPVKVVKRTSKFLTILIGKKLSKVGVKNHDGFEYALPDGAYSMAPSIYPYNIYKN